MYVLHGIRFVCTCMLFIDFIFFFNTSDHFLWCSGHDIQYKVIQGVVRSIKSESQPHSSPMRNLSSIFFLLTPKPTAKLIPSHTQINTVAREPAYTAKTPTVHQVITMLGTSKNVLSPRRSQLPANHRY